MQGAHAAPVLPCRAQRKSPTGAAPCTKQGPHCVAVTVPSLPHCSRSCTPALPHGAAYTAIPQLQPQRDAPNTSS